MRLAMPEVIKTLAISMPPTVIHTTLVVQGANAACGFATLATM